MHRRDGGHKALSQEAPVIQFKRKVQKRVREEGTAVPRIIEQEQLSVLNDLGSDSF